MIDDSSPRPAPPPPPGPPPGHAAVPSPGPAVAQAWSPPRVPVAPAPPSPGVVALTSFWQARSLPCPPVTLLTAATVGVLAGTALVGHRPGLGAAVVGAAVWAPAVPHLRARRSPADLALVALATALVGVAAVRDAWWLVALCLLAATGVATVAASSARTTPGTLLAPVTAVLGLARAVPWLAAGAGHGLGRRRAPLVAAGRTVVVTAALLLVFGWLFSSADAVFAAYLPRPRLDLLPARVVVGALVALTAAALAHVALAPPTWARARSAPGASAGRAEWLVPVLALAGLTWAFVLVQVGALRGGHAHVLQASGLTYAQYARSGFAQLVVATVLTLAVVAVAVRRAPRGQVERRASRAALVLLCLGTVGVVLSALRRMDLYVEAFGLTRLRLLVTVAEAALGVVLLLVVLAVVLDRSGWLPRTAVALVGVTLLGLAAADPDTVVLRHNTSARLEVPVDVAYLRGLSADVVPAADRLPEPWRTCLLQGRSVPTPGVADWNLARARAARVLDGVPASDACASLVDRRPDTSGVTPGAG